MRYVCAACVEHRAVPHVIRFLLKFYNGSICDACTPASHYKLFYHAAEECDQVGVVVFQWYSSRNSHTQCIYCLQNPATWEPGECVCKASETYVWLVAREK